MRWSGPLTVLALLAAAVATVQSFRVAEEAGQLEIQLREQRDQASVLRTQAEDLRRDKERLAGETMRLERELDAALSWSQSLGEVFAKESERRERASVAAAAAAALVLNPPPFGVQRCMQALRDCLRAEGHEGMQLVRASAIEGNALSNVEFLTVDRASQSAELVVAARMTVRLDRRVGSVSLRFFDGFVRTHGLRVELPQEGRELRLDGVDGRMWEQKLPYVIQAEGSYADPATSSAPTPNLDRETRETWIERLDALLFESGSDLKLRVAGFVYLEGREFCSARVVGYDASNLLALSVDCERLCVEIDRAARVVSLRMKNGTLRRPGSESSIQGEGYRMLLPNITPERASMILMGMVVER